MTAAKATGWSSTFAKENRHFLSLLFTARIIRFLSISGLGNDLKFTYVYHLSGSCLNRFYVHFEKISDETFVTFSDMKM